MTEMLALLNGNQGDVRMLEPVEHVIFHTTSLTVLEYGVDGQQIGDGYVLESRNNDFLDLPPNGLGGFDFVQNDDGGRKHCEVVCGRL